MKERLGRLGLRETKKRELAFEAMSDAGLMRIEGPDFTVSTRKGAPGLVVITQWTVP